MPSVSISSSVGSGCTNKAGDVRKIQEALNGIEPQWGGPNPKLAVDGDCKFRTNNAIGNLQRWQFGWEDYQISAGGVTLKRINDMLSAGEKPGAPDTIRARWEFSYPYVGQVKSMGCWAATAAMLLCARDHKEYSLEQALEKADGGAEGLFHLLFLTDKGLPWEHHEKFTKALGFKREGGKSFAVKSIADWLRWTPLGVILEFKNRSHVVALTGMRGDGTVYGTYGMGYDPMGKSFIYSWRTLQGQYELADYKTIWRC